MTPHARTTKISESILEELWFGEDDASAITAQAAARLRRRPAPKSEGGLRPFSEVGEARARTGCRQGRLQVIKFFIRRWQPRSCAWPKSAAFRSTPHAFSIKQAIMVLGSRTLSDWRDVPVDDGHVHQFFGASFAKSAAPQPEWCDGWPSPAANAGCRTVTSSGPLARLAGSCCSSRPNPPPTSRFTAIKWPTRTPSTCASARYWVSTTPC